MSKQTFFSRYRTARNWLRDRHAAERPWNSARDANVMGPTSVREVEERIPATDEAGNRRTLLRIRTLVGVLGPTGLVEVERARRHTLPGLGHVYPISGNEYVVFNGRMKLRVDLEAAVNVRKETRQNAPSPSEYDAEHLGTTLVSAVSPPVRVRRRRPVAPLYFVLVALLLTVAIWQDHSPRQAAPPFSPATAGIDNAGPVANASGTEPRTLPAVRMGGAHPAALPTELPTVDDRITAPPRRTARLALAIRPRGVVYVNGKRRGTSPPLKELTLEPGRYRVEIRNDSFQPYQTSVDLRGVAEARIAHDFNKATKEVAKKSAPKVASTTRPYTRFLSEEWPR